jgi:hypothetical protein
MQTVRLESSAQLSTLHARVKHVRPTFTGEHYLIGLEFVTPEPHAVEHISRLLSHHVNSLEGPHA